MEHLVIKVKTDNDYDMLINMDNVLHIIVSSDGGYMITFVDNRQMKLSWKEFERLDKAIQKVSQ